MKRARSVVSSEMVEEFFEEVKKAFEAFPGEVKKENIFNSDETNFTNDPGKMMVLARLGRSGKCPGYQLPANRRFWSCGVAVRLGSCYH